MTTRRRAVATCDDSTRTTRWAGIPAADRVTERRTLLLDAALELLGTEGWAGTSVRAVCHQARLNPRYFYESFPHLDALVVALFDRLVEELRVEVAAAVAAAVAADGDDPQVRVRAMVAATAGFVDVDRRRARVLYVESLGNEALNRRRLETGTAIADEMEAESAARHGRPSERDQIGRICAAFLVGGFSELLMRWLDGRLDVSREQLVDDATALFLALGRAAESIAINRRSG